MHAAHRPDTAAAAPRPEAASDIARLQAALEYLLIANMNAQTPFESGAPSNGRLLTFFFNLLPKLEPALFFDIGANDGSTAAFAKTVLPGCDVTAVEANPHIQHASHAALTARGVNALHLAVAPERGQVTIYAPRTLSKAFVNGQVIDTVVVEPLNTGKSSLLKRDEDATYDEHRVEAWTLDDLVASRPVPATGRRDTVLWIDVEGAAYEVLSGAAGAALARTSAIFIETEGHGFWSEQKKCSDVARLLIAEGFLPVQRDREYDDKQFNTVFLHHSLTGLLLPQNYEIAAPAAPVRTEPVAPPTRARRQYRSLAACLVADVPVFVPVFNNPTYASAMLLQLLQRGIKNVFLVDNRSNYRGMLDFLNAAQDHATVIRLEENKGPHDLFTSDTNFACLPDIFCVTDPDIELGNNMPADFLYDLLTLTNKHGIGKAGLALDISEPERLRPERYSHGGRDYSIFEWESQFWSDKVDAMPEGSPVFKAGIDTTFALYNKRFFRRETFYEALRAGGRYTARHLPWYKDVQIPQEEDAAYRSTQRFSCHMR